jgi:hypothetical protein
MFVKKKQDRGCVLGKERKPKIVGCGYRAAQGVLVNVADCEVLEEPPSPAFSYGHQGPLYVLVNTKLISSSSSSRCALNVTAREDEMFVYLAVYADPLRPPLGASQTEFGKPLVDFTFTLALVTGQSVTDVSQNVFANLVWAQVRLPNNPVFEVDTIYSRSEVLEKRESKSRPDVGIVRVETTGFNQDGTAIITFVRTIMVYKKDWAPKVARLTPGELAPDTSVAR